jgi:heme exporter protein D
MNKDVLPVLYPLFLGQLPPPTAEAMYTWLATAVALLGIYYLVLKIVQAHRRNPPFEMELTHFARREHLELIQVQLPNFATKPEVQAVARDLGDQLTAAVRHLDQKRSDSIAGIHKQLEAAQVEAAKVAQQAEHHSQQLAQLDHKIDVMPERIINLLKSQRPAR